VSSRAYIRLKLFLVRECSPPRTRERHARDLDAKFFLTRILPVVREGGESTDPIVSRVALTVLARAINETWPQRMCAV
jgi:hypothetical protein